MQPLYKMNRAAQVLANVMPSRWAFEGLLVLEASKRPVLELPAGLQEAAVALPLEGYQGVRFDRESQDMAERFFPAHDHRHSTLAVAAAMSVMLLTLLVVIAVLLRSRDLH